MSKVINNINITDQIESDSRLVVQKINTQEQNVYIGTTVSNANEQDTNYLEVVNADKQTKYLPVTIVNVHKSLINKITPYLPVKSLPVYTKLDTKSYVKFAQANIAHSYYIYLNSVTSLYFTRKNSNIYKNVIPYTVQDYYDIITESVNETVDIRQPFHGLSRYDLVYCDENGFFQKALAADSIQANVVGIITEIKTPSVFTLMLNGNLEIKPNITPDKSSILYLSDKKPGKFASYSDIENNIYVPVGTYLDKKVILNIKQGVVGNLAEYQEEWYHIETYTEEEINDTINQIIQRVKT